MSFVFSLEVFLPRYDYRCKQCGNKFELKQSFDAEAVADCTQCDGTANRVIYSVPVVFKGAGFYVNDYGKGNVANTSSNSNEEKAEKESSSSDNKAESAKSENKADSTNKPTKNSAGKKE
jgi:putative FmdB family regulatory protein